MGLQTARGYEQEKSTRAREGTRGMVGWDGETISIKYSNEGDAVVAEVRTNGARMRLASLG